MKLRPIILKITLAAAITVCAASIYAQPGGGSGLGGGSNTGPPPPVGAPIDGGAGMLLAAVAGYAYRRLR